MLKSSHDRKLKGEKKNLSEIILESIRLLESPKELVNGMQEILYLILRRLPFHNIYTASLQYPENTLFFLLCKS